MSVELCFTGKKYRPIIIGALNDGILFIAVSTDTILDVKVHECVRKITVVFSHHKGIIIPFTRDVTVLYL